MMLIVLLILTILCALQAVRATQLLTATIWLAVVSALVAVMLYTLGAWQISVIELSVGTGLVTVLMVFAITMVGNERETIVGRRLPSLLVIVSVLLFITLTVPFIPIFDNSEQQSLSQMMWQERGLDLVLQVALIFSGILGVIGLLSAAKNAESILRDFPPTQSAHPQPERHAQSPEKEAA